MLFKIVTPPRKITNQTVPMDPQEAKVMLNMETESYGSGWDPIL